MPTLGPHADALGHAGALQKVPATKQDRTLEWLRWLERTQHAPVCALHVRPGLPVALVGDRLYPAGAKSSFQREMNVLLWICTLSIYL